MSLFAKAETTTAYLKMAFMGFQGSGKTYTATSTAIGLVQLMREMRSPAGDLPIAFIDTEKGSDWIKPRIEKAGLALVTAKTRSFSDLLSAVPEAEQGASLLLIDSLTHFWVELCDSYMKAKNRTRLQFEDWAFLKTRWRMFTDQFVNSPLHIIVCGRAGFEYDYSKDEETGKKNLEKTGIKMKAEGEMGYEPDLLVLMEREMNMATMTNHHIARVMKDRSTLLDGKEFPEPTFETFLPHIECLNLGGRHLGVDTTRNSVASIPKDVRDNRRTQRIIVLAEIEEVLTTHFPSTGKDDKLAKVKLVRKHFGATWAECDEVMPLEQLRAGYDSLYVELEGKPSRYAIRVIEPAKVEINDSLPDSVTAATDPDPMTIPPALDRRFNRDVLPMPLPVSNGQTAFDEWVQSTLNG